MSPHVTETPGAKVITTISSRAVMLMILDEYTETHVGAFLSSDEARKIAAELIQYADEADAVPVPTEKEREMMMNHFRDHGKMLRVEDIREGMQ